MRALRIPPPAWQIAMVALSCVEIAAGVLIIAPAARACA